jgi:hypothetical protein
MQSHQTNQSLNNAGSSKRSTMEEFKMKRLQAYNSNEVPDPEVLKSILENKQRAGNDYIKEV